MQRDRKAEESARKLFVGGLNYDTTDDELKQYFEQYGVLDDYVVMRFPDGTRRSRGFGFITYANVDDLETCFSAGPHTLRDKTVELKRATPRESTAGGKRRYDETDPEASVDPEDKIMRKLFIGGLSYNTTDDAMREYFERYGAVEDAVIMKFPDSTRSRGFGFITYEKAAGVDACQKDRPHTIDNRTIDTKRATPRGAGGPSGRAGRADDPSSQATSKKLFIGNLSEAMTDEDLSGHFSQFGQVLKVEQLRWNDTQKKRGFGFIEFDDHDTVDKVCLMGRHLILGKSVEVRKALTKHEMAGMKKVKMDDGGHWGAGGGRGDYGGGHMGGGGGQGGWGRGGHHGGGGMHHGGGQDMNNMNPMMMMNMMMGMMNGQPGQGGQQGGGNKSYTSFSGGAKQERGFGSSGGGSDASAGGGYNASGYGGYGGAAGGGGSGGYGGYGAGGAKSDASGVQNWSVGYGSADGGWGQYSGAGGASSGGGAMRNSSSRDSSGPYYRQ